MRTLLVASCLLIIQPSWPQLAPCSWDPERVLAQTGEIIVTNKLKYTHSVLGRRRALYGTGTNFTGSGEEWASLDEVIYNRPFDENPLLVISINGMELCRLRPHDQCAKNNGSEPNVRVYIRAVSGNETGFALQVQVPHSASFHRLVINWLAMLEEYSYRPSDGNSQFIRALLPTIDYTAPDPFNQTDTMNLEPYQWTEEPAWVPGFWFIDVSISRRCPFSIRAAVQFTWTQATVNGEPVDVLGSAEITVDNPAPRNIPPGQGKTKKNGDVIPWTNPCEEEWLASELLFVGTSSDVTDESSGFTGQLVLVQGGQARLGTRTRSNPVRKRMKFDRPFGSFPTVFVAISEYLVPTLGFDKLSLFVSHHDVTREGFELRLEDTWDTEHTWKAVDHVLVNYVAIGLGTEGMEITMTTDEPELTRPAGDVVNVTCQSPCWMDPSTPVQFGFLLNGQFHQLPDQPELRDSMNLATQQIVLSELDNGRSYVCRKSFLSAWHGPEDHNVTKLSNPVRFRVLPPPSAIAPPPPPASAWMPVPGVDPLPLVDPLPVGDPLLVPGAAQEKLYHKHVQTPGLLGLLRRSGRERTPRSLLAIFACITLVIIQM